MLTGDEQPLPCSILDVIFNVGKKKSKFQTFKNFFAKKKRKEAATPAGDNGLKSSQSSDNVNAPEPAFLIRSEKDEGSG